MTEDPTKEPAGGSGEAEGASPDAVGAARRLPGLAAIGLYMVYLAGAVILGVVKGSLPHLYLLFPPLFIAAGFGLLMLFRWAWALTLAAVVLLMVRFFYAFAADHAGSEILGGAVNLVFFLYLIRTEVRQRLR